MAHEMKTEIGKRNVLVQFGAGTSLTIWLEVELQPDATSGITCLALLPDEACQLGEELIKASQVAEIQLEKQARSLTEG